MQENVTQRYAEKAQSLTRDPAEDENWRLLQERGLHVVLAGEDQDWHSLRRLVRQADVVVDALLGTGTRLPLRGALAERRDTPRETLTSLVATAPPLSPQSGG